MRATLDHIGIAVGDLHAALRFFRDALGLEVTGTEEVPSQAVRAHFLPVGETVLELLEATADDSPIARFLKSHRPGLHHLTFRVADLDRALARLRETGARLIDEEPRIGAEGARVVFVHPSSAHGVLVELKEAAPPAAQAGPMARRLAFGDVELVSLSDGSIGLDGGAMFGVVPKPLWQRQAPADARNRIRIGLRPLVVRGERTVLIDAGIGDKMPPKLAEIYAFDRARHLDHALAEAGLSAERIDVVIASHLHFDHAGGFTRTTHDGQVRPRFPNARYLIRRGEWEDAVAPGVRSRASYRPEDFLPLAEAGVVELIDDDEEVLPGIRVRRTGGHTRHHQLVEIRSGGRVAMFAADLLPTTAHLPEAWVMGYDLYPVDTVRAKQAFVREVAADEALVFFEHDPEVAAGYIRERDGTWTVERVL